MTANVYFVGAGPGDPELITLKGKNLLEQADAVLWPGSLVNPQLLRCCKNNALIRDTSEMDLPEIIAFLSAQAMAGKLCVRLHTGDPSLYGAVREQIEALKTLGIGCITVPGVSSLMAGSAALNREFTPAGISQTLIITRAQGRTKVPDEESLESLSVHCASMAIFLSADKIEAVAETLLKNYPKQTPCAVVYKTTWPEEQIIRGDLSGIAQKTRQADISRHALIFVGAFLGDQFEPSQLYNPDFTHGYRTGKKI